MKIINYYFITIFFFKNEGINYYYLNNKLINIKIKTLMYE